MKARPILFSGPMIRALLDGTKTQARRACKVESLQNGMITPRAGYSPRSPESHAGYCPYGQPGDLLWVRETWGIGTRPCPHEGWVDGLEYRADDFGLDDHDLLPLHPLGAREDLDLDQYRGQWRPSIHMPRWASRLTLRVTDVRVERVQDITVDDERAEGVNVEREAFDMLWDSINAKRGFGWDANPWVWALTFEVIQKNVDQVLADPTPRTAP